jgi:hypothetical protein
MSGLDEQQKLIPACPNCGRKTKFWSIFGETRRPLGFLNYSRGAVLTNGEFNLKHPRAVIKIKACYIECTTCDYQDNDELFQQGIKAILTDSRRFRDFVRTR